MKQLAFRGNDVKAKRYSYKVSKNTSKGYKRKALIPRFGSQSKNLSNVYPYRGIPNTVNCKHDYFFIFNFSSGATASTNIMRLNSLWDPDQSGVGAQPYYRDELAALYNKYCVYGCKVKATYAIDSGISCTVGFKAQNDTSVLTNANLALERPEAKTVIINPGQRTITQTKYYAMNQLFGVRRSTILDENDYKATANTNPANEQYLQIFAQPSDNFTASVGRIVLRMTFYTKWSDRIRQSQS